MAFIGMLGILDAHTLHVLEEKVIIPSLTLSLNMPTLQCQLRIELPIVPQGIPITVSLAAGVQMIFQMEAREQLTALLGTPTTV
jgi:hypothetical protein